MKGEQFDYPCSRTFREGLPDLRVDYRASNTFTGPPSRRRTRSPQLFADQARDEWLQEIKGLQSSRDEWMRRAIAAEAELERVRTQLRKFRAKDAEGFTGITELRST